MRVYNFSAGPSMLFEDVLKEAQASFLDYENSGMSKKIITPIERTTDGKFYVISLEVYKDEQPCDIRLGIRERNDALNWVNNIYQDIPIIYIPKSIE